MGCQNRNLALYTILIYIRGKYEPPILFLYFFHFQKNHGDPRIANIFVSLNKASATHPFATERHVGDLGNIFTGSNDHPTQVHIVDNVISLEDGKENNILGRAIVVHAGKIYKSSKTLCMIFNLSTYVLSTYFEFSFSIFYWISSYRSHKIKE